MVGFKYDIDAISYMHQGTLTIKMGNGLKIRMNPIPTKAFQHMIAQYSDRSPMNNF